MRRIGWSTALLIAAGAGAAAAEPAPPNTPVLEARISCRPMTLAGDPLWMEFQIRNLSDEPVTLTVADQPQSPDPMTQMGLPIEHVFSGKLGDSLRITEEDNPNPVTYRLPTRPEAARKIVLAAHGSIGTRIDMTILCDSFRRAGTYKVQWRPYQGALESNTLDVVVSPLRRATIFTDFGTMKVEFYYDAAPKTVDNFISLVDKGFYNGLRFHNILAGGWILGGDPRGDGTGIRPDGKLIPAELSNIPLDVGSLVMATRKGAPNTASCQFYICLARLPQLDGKQTVFGRLVGRESFETLQVLGRQPTDSNHRPLQPVYIRAISLENVPSHEASRIGGGTAERSPGGTTTRPANAPSSGRDDGAPSAYRLLVGSPEPPTTTRPSGDVASNGRR